MAASAGDADRDGDGDEWLVVTGSAAISAQSWDTSDPPPPFTVDVVVWMCT